MLGACRQQEPAGPTERTAEAAVTVYAGPGRDRLCLAPGGGVAGFVTYAASSESNCSVRGNWDANGPQAIAPNGDQSCSITFNREGESVTLLAGTPACAYYCGPGAAFTGKTFVRMDSPAPATDIAGDPLC